MIVLAVTLAALSACGDDPAVTTPAPATSTTTASSPTPGAASAPPSPVASAAAADKEVVITIAKKKITPPTSRVEVAKGDLVRVTVTSDVPDEVHIHGYDKTLRLSPGTPASLDLRADKTGLFEVETHETQLVLFQLVVR
jgi:FtsP/CotA-like multicopper oxidase with cupredoxin domain